MPHTPSVKKALRRSGARRKQNLARKDVLKTTLKHYKELIAGGKRDEAKAYLPEVYKRLDKSSKVNLIQTKKAARYKSRLSKLLETT